MTIPDKPTSKNQKYIVKSDGKGDYTREREEFLKDITIEDFEKFLQKK